MKARHKYLNWNRNQWDITMACSIGMICWLWICRRVPAWPFRAVCRPPLGCNRKTSTSGEMCYLGVKLDISSSFLDRFINVLLFLGLHTQTVSADFWIKSHWDWRQMVTLRNCTLLMFVYPPPHTTNMFVPWGPFGPPALGQRTADPPEWLLCWPEYKQVNRERYIVNNINYIRELWQLIIIAHCVIVVSTLLKDKSELKRHE